MDIRGIIANVAPLVSVLAWILLAYLILLWAASVLWTYRDIHSRSEDVAVQVLAVTLALVLPFGGVLLHLILRPRQTLTQKYERMLEEEYLRRNLEDPHVCPTCQRPVEPDFILCPHCQTALRRRCGSCGRVIDLAWSICPYCGDDGTGVLQRPSYRQRVETEHAQLYER
ncbi:MULTISPECIES: zinc ribbon domain-containing protein [Roseiflexus]|uniref:DZANK-type domain-containing protein n=1 Tax=Roseiflexus castenholzii (strain DSM 13941 / HLO8) TaxID=383372 RepID=A7NQB2_ROSCS|nr:MULTISPECIES: zinc ribbon domain-containing protein [Roseiflexus]ABU59758.1 conserved hypothetical protein [Roseiflexus castenholzii DSM 13941]PMP84857.1 MAG: zinc ribbon domain-containing protein [Roseiflexus castenholzii]GIW03211.1 MAG: hypothetical protein KatS3mg058_4614 [Roseiflexus sp.]